MPSIQFDSTEILNSTYLPRYVKHESVAERIISSLDLARSDGQVFITEKYGVKKIILVGVLTASSQANLETAIDTFAELLSRTQKNLDVSYAGGTRRYVATCSRHEFDRDHFHLLYAPWTAEFTVLSGEGKDSSTTTPINAEDYNTTGGTATDSFTMLGSKPARPTIKLKNNTGSAIGVIKGFRFLNVDTNEKIDITFTAQLGNQGYVTINCDSKVTTEDLDNGGAEAQIDFYGIFPNFKIGTNNFKIYAGGIPNQENDLDVTDSVSTSVLLNATTTYDAYSFEVPYANATFQGLSIYGKINTGGTPGDLTVDIQTDNGNKPSGSAVSDSTITFAYTDFTDAYSWVTKYSAAAFTLSANTKYWIVFRAAIVNSSNYYQLATSFIGGTVYSKGLHSLSTDTGSTWTTYSGNHSLPFAIRYGGGIFASTTAVTISYNKTYL